MNQMIRAAVTIVSISLAHLCASTANAAGSWTAWGWNLDGQATVPVDAGFRQIAAGNLHSIGLREDGTVMGWGEDTFGQASPPGGLLGVIQVAAGGWYQLPGTDRRAHSAALLSDGTVRVWGNNQFGQCNVPPALGQVIQVECGWAHTAVVTMERTVVVWGAGSADNADPNWGQRLVPTGLQGVGSISTKGCHIMALLLDGTVRCWGRNQERQCDAPPLTGVVKIAAGSDHSMALTANGELRSWGWDYYRQVTDQPEAERFQSIAACMYGSIGLTMDGRVLQWGYAMGPPPSGLQCVESITAGGFHAFAYRGTDSDGDGVCDSRDNCPSIVNPDQADCDHDGAGDACEIANGSTSDLNHNGTPDTCECLGDLLADGRIDGADLGAVLSYWGPASSSPTSQACDIDKNGVVNGADLGLLLSNWGPCSN